MQKRNYLVLIAAAVIALLTVASNSPAIAQQVSGAIFTTDANSNFVNGNVYDSMDEVYLDGGPRPNAPCTAAGLPDGYYYFQVTDPSGSVRLSRDPIDQRQVYIEGGVIVAVSGHAMGFGKCRDTKPNNITVQLMPFDATPNPGGEYKAWMTKVVDYDTTETKGSFGFIPSKSKTDNFKVAPPVEGCPDQDPSCTPG